MASKILAEVNSAAIAFEERWGRKINLTVIIVGANPASQVYVKRKHSTCIENNIASDIVALPEDVTQTELISVIDKLNHDSAVDGILVQLPLPKHIGEQAVIAAIAPHKDVDGFHAINTGNLFSGCHSFVSCTPAGVMEILKYYDISPAGKHAVIIGRSNIVGKPMALLLIQADATVTVCHSKTRDLVKYTRDADIVVAAIGRPKFVTADMVNSECIVIDVGINRSDGAIVGDCDYATLLDNCAAITPVPGGVGVLTIAMLLKNTVQAALMNN